jgi:hypothetical protein
LEEESARSEPTNRLAADERDGKRTGQRTINRYAALAIVRVSKSMGLAENKHLAASLLPARLERSQGAPPAPLRPNF